MQVGFNKQKTLCSSLSFNDIYLYSLNSFWLNGTSSVIDPNVPVQTVYQCPQSGPDTGHAVCDHAEPGGTCVSNLAALGSIYMHRHGRCPEHMHYAWSEQIPC